MSEETKKPEWLKDMQVLRLRPGDVIVLRSKRPISGPEYEIIKAVMTERFPNNRTMILEDGMDIGVISGEVDDE
jgi:hypothetical protein